MEARAVKWWGWGWDDVSFSLDSRPALARLLQEGLHVDLAMRRTVVPLADLQLPPCLLTPDDLDQLRRLVGEGNVSVDTADRAVHAVGKGYRDLLRIRSGRIERAPDAVVYPEDEASVRRVLDFARRRRCAVIPFGGGTSVTGGVEPPATGAWSAVLTMDLRRMRRVLAIDEGAGLVTAEAGLRGPLLEEALNARGLSLGHFPQSWEFSTVGGWIATRAAGSLSNRYGRIEDLVVGVRLVSPTRTVDLPALPARAHGPDLKELILGSEGTLGVITQATLRAHPLPRTRRFASRLFRSFGDGLAALQAMAKEDALPDMTYLSDEEETRFLAAEADLGPRGEIGGITRILLRVLERRGFSLDQGGLLLMEFEGSPAQVVHRMRRALDLARDAASLGAFPAERFYRRRFEAPYLRDSLLDHGILVDTVETAAPWSRLPALYKAGRKALREALWRTGTPGIVLCHVSHVYADGASLYYTFLGCQQEGRETEQWSSIKEAVTTAFLEEGGALSHHHGIGADHAPYLARVIGEDGLVVLWALKRELDPEGIMNPGKVLQGGI